MGVRYGASECVHPSTHVHFGLDYLVYNIICVYVLVSKRAYGPLSFQHGLELINEDLCHIKAASC